MRILVADDDIDIAVTLERLFPSEHEVVHVASGHTAFERIAIGRAFDVVLCEIQLPDIGGIELHRRLSECAPNTAGRIVFLTTDPEPHRGFLSSVKNTYLTKPVAASALRQLIRDLALH
jgi:CheY-like chemotaxis protein